MEKRYHITKHIRNKITNHVEVLDLEKPEKVIKQLIDCANDHGYSVTQTFKNKELFKAMVEYDNSINNVMYFINAINEEVN